MTPKKLKISIVTVCFNAEATLNRTIESVTKQNYTDIEYIVVDGGSKDKTLTIIRQHNHSISKWISEPDKGIYYAMNKGIDLATGDFILFLNADDYLHKPDVIGKVVRELNKNTDLDILYGKVLCISESPRYHYISHKKLTKRGIKKGIHPPHPATFTKRSVFDKLGRYNTDFRLLADIDFSCRVFKSQLKYTHIDLIVSVFQIGGSSINKNITLNERLAIIRTHFGNQAYIKHLIFEKPKYYIWLLLKTIGLLAIYGYALKWHKESGFE